MLEIEQAIYDLHNVRHAVVVPSPARHDPSQQQLVAYIVADAALRQNPAELRKRLAEKLPLYMIPSFFVFLDAMPLNINGKVDKKALPPVQDTRELQQSDPPMDDIERKLISVWKDVLKTEYIGIDDGFFDLGGDSLLATHLLLSIEKAFARAMPLAVISKASTIRQQAEILRGEDANDYASVLFPIQPKGNKSPIFCIGGKGGNPIRFRLLLNYLGDEHPVYFFRSRGFEPGEKIATSIEEIASDYVREIKKIQPVGPYYFFGESSGGLVAYEIAQQLVEKGEPASLIGMLDTYLAEMKDDSISSNVNWVTVIRKHFQTLTNGGLHGLKAYVDYYVELLKFKAGEYREAGKNKKLRSRYGELPDVYRLVEDANILASRIYSPKPYSGKVVLFTAKRQLMLEGNLPDHGWGKVGIESLSVYPLDCYHGNILFEPFVRQVAEKFNQHLNED